MGQPRDISKSLAKLIEYDLRVKELELEADRVRPTDKKLAIKLTKMAEKCRKQAHRHYVIVKRYTGQDARKWRDAQN